MRGTTDQTMNLTRTLKKNSEADLFPAPDGGRPSAITIETLKGELMEQTDPISWSKSPLGKTRNSTGNGC